MKPYAEDGQAKGVPSQQHKVKVNIYLCTYMHVITMKIRGHKFERKREDIWEGLEGGMGSNHNLKIIILNAEYFFN